MTGKLNPICPAGFTASQGEKQEPRKDKCVISLVWCSAEQQYGILWPLRGEFQVLVSICILNFPSLCHHCCYTADTWNPTLINALGLKENVLRLCVQVETGDLASKEGSKDLIEKLLNQAYRFRSLCPFQTELSITFNEEFYRPRNYKDLMVDTVRMQNTLRFGIQVSWFHAHSVSVSCCLTVSVSCCLTVSVSCCLTVYVSCCLTVCLFL